MKFIKDQKKYNKIKEMASNNDEKAKDFLFNFMEMSDEEANEYLSQIAIDDEGNQEDWKSIIEDLIADENEAIDGYDKAIKYLINSNVEDKDKKLDVLKHIKDEEIEHIEELKEIIEYGLGK